MDDGSWSGRYGECCTLKMTLVSGLYGEYCTPPLLPPLLHLAVQMRANIPMPLMHPMPGVPPMPTPLMAGMPPRPHPPPLGEDPAAKRARSDQDNFIPENQFIAQHPVSVE